MFAVFRLSVKRQSKGVQCQRGRQLGTVEKGVVNCKIHVVLYEVIVLRHKKCLGHHSWIKSKFTLTALASPCEIFLGEITICYR